MLKFFGDETGIDTQPTTRISAVAGLVGGDRQWVAFDRNWNKVLREEGIPYFHAVECERAKDNFYGLDVTKRGHIVDRLTRVIITSHVALYSYGVVVPHFREMSFEFRNHYTSGRPEIPYFLCLAQMFTSASHAADGLPSDEQVYFVFEEQQQFKADAESLFGQFKANPIWPNSKRLAGCHFAKSNEIYQYPGIQAADLLAYEAYRHLDNRYFQQDMKPEWKNRTVLKALREKLIKHNRYFDRDALNLLEEERLRWEREGELERRIQELRQYDEEITERT